MTKQTKTKAKTKPQRKRKLVQGKDFDFWAYQFQDGTSGTTLHYVLPTKGAGYKRVKLVEVKL